MRGTIGRAAGIALLASCLGAGAAAGCAGELDREERAEPARSSLVFCDGPTIDSWYGETLRFGMVGHPQRDVNVLGNAAAEEGPVSLWRSLNGGPFVAVPLGPEGVRLHAPGDFNIAIARSALRGGDNTLELRAEDEGGATCEAALTLQYAPGTSWPLPYEASFGELATAEDIERAVQVVDGPWAPTGDGLRTTTTGYYRTLAAGEESWAPGYEARATVTVHYLGDWSGVGLGIGWRGHTGSADPPVDWPVGALGWVRVKTTGPELEIKTFDQGTPRAMPVDFRVGETYVFELRSEPLDADSMRVATRVWPSSSAPPGWIAATLDRRGGSVVLLAHGADVTWHDVRLRSLAGIDGGHPEEDGGGHWPDGGAPPADDGSTPTDGAAHHVDGGAPPNTDVGRTGGSDAGGCSAAPADHTPPWTFGLLAGLLLWRGRTARRRTTDRPRSKRP